MIGPSPLTSDFFGDRVGHGFFGRAGGVSKGIYAKLNCGFGSNDDAENVAANRARVSGVMQLEPGHLLTVFQTHSPDVLTIEGPHDFEAAPKADAMVTSTPGLGLAILTADCAPILLADEAAGVIGAAHAGWRGAFGGVIENTVAAMEKLGAHRERTRAAIGPAIGQVSYEVDEEFRNKFLADDPGNEVFFAASPKDGHCHFDLPAYCAARLQAAGIAKVDDLGLCTYADEEQFFSYRRATHRGEPDYGRNISVIVLRS